VLFNLIQKIHATYAVGGGYRGRVSATIAALLSDIRNLRHRQLAATALALTALICVSVSTVAAAPMVVGNGLILACSQPGSGALRCDYRLTANSEPLAATASIGEMKLPNPTFAARTGAPASIAVLLLVDTSDPARAAAIDKAREHIARLVNDAEPHLRFGLAAFDSDLEMLAPIGSDIDSIVAAANALSAKGRTTELYRNVVRALNLLATATDEHKVLMVLSDGLAEDRAYFHADAIKAALDSRIAIYSIGYPRSVALSVGLQSLRRLADESGGRFTPVDNKLNLPEAFFLESFTSIENVGAISVDLSAASDAFAGGTHDLHVTLETNAGLTDATVRVNFAARIVAEPVVKVVKIEVPKVIEVERIVRVPQQSVAPSPTNTAAASQPAGVPLWYWIVAIGLLALALLVLLLVLLMQRRSTAAPSRAKEPIPTPVSMEGLAFLTLDQDSKEIPHPIRSAAFRIGRMMDNDLVVDDTSVSRHHAEVRRRRDGSFEVLDLNSMNGVFINGKKVRESKLNDDDLLDVGDIRMRFSAENVNAVGGEETVMLRTVLPVQPFPDAARR
jgi:hypothetical protein